MSSPTHSADDASLPRVLSPLEVRASLRQLAPRIEAAADKYDQEFELAAAPLRAWGGTAPPVGEAVRAANVALARMPPGASMFNDEAAFGRFLDPARWDDADLAHCAFYGLASICFGSDYGEPNSVRLTHEALQADPQVAGQFSAVEYGFARYLAELNVRRRACLSQASILTEASKLGLTDERVFREYSRVTDGRLSERAARAFDAWQECREFPHTVILDDESVGLEPFGDADWHRALEAIRGPAAEQVTDPGRSEVPSSGTSEALNRRERLHQIVAYYRRQLAGRAEDLVTLRLPPAGEGLAGLRSAVSRTRELLVRHGLGNWLIRRFEAVLSATTQGTFNAAIDTIRGDDGSSGEAAKDAFEKFLTVRLVIPHTPASWNVLRGMFLKPVARSIESVEGGDIFDARRTELAQGALNRIVEAAARELIACESARYGEALRRELAASGYQKRDLEAMAVDLGRSDSTGIALFEAALEAWESAPLLSASEVAKHNLNDRQLAIIDSLFKEGATDKHRRVKTERLATLVDGPNASANGFKRPVSLLVKLKFLESSDGRGSGVWLTSSGQKVAQEQSQD